MTTPDIRKAEPVAWMRYGNGCISICFRNDEGAFPVYSTPPAAPVTGEQAIRAHAHLIRCFADDINERNWDDKRLYIRRQVDHLVGELAAPSPVGDRDALIEPEHKRNSPFVPVPNSGTIVPNAAADIDDILHALEEAKGFAAVSPAGRENIAFAIDALPDRFEQKWREGFQGGEKHAHECIATDRQRIETLASERDDLIKTLEKMADLVESRVVIIERLQRALSEEKGIVADLLSENKRLADLVIAYRLSEAEL